MIITPILFDLVISVTAVIIGLYTLVWKMKIYTPKVYTPLLGSMIILIGLMGWCLFSLASYSAIYQEPAWVYVEGLYGSWAYSVGRVIFLVYWCFVQHHIVKYSPKCKKDRVVII